MSTTTTKRLFISSVTNDFEELRESLKQKFDQRREFKPITQSILPPTPFVLGTIADNVHDCDVVIQLLGSNLGSIPPTQDVSKLLTEWPDLKSDIASDSQINEWTYTHWEGVLAIQFKKDLFPCISPDLQATLRLDNAAKSQHANYLSWLRAKSVHELKPPEFSDQPLFDYILEAVQARIESVNRRRNREEGQRVTAQPRIVAGSNSDAMILELLDTQGNELFQKLAEEMRWGRKQGIAKVVNQLDSWLKGEKGTSCSTQVRARCQLIVMNAFIDLYQTSKPVDQEKVSMCDRLKIVDHEVCKGDAELYAMLLSVTAWLKYLDGEPSTAISQLKGCLHDVATANLLSMMIQQSQWSEAEKIVDTRFVTERWLEQGLLVLIHVSRLDEAAKLFTKVEHFESTVRKHRCYFIYADSLRAHAFLNRERGSKLFPYDVMETERSILHDAYTALEPLRSRVKGNKKIDGELELAGMELAYQLEYLLSLPSIDETGNFLAESSPITKILPTIVFQGKQKANRDSYQKLASDWPNDNEAFLGAAAICVFQNEHPEDAIEILSRVSLSELDGEQSQQLSDIYCNIACIAKTPEREQAYNQLETLKQPDDPVLNLVRAVWENEKSSFKVAIQMLDEKPMVDDPDWLSVYVQSLNNLERYDEAFEKVKLLVAIAPFRNAYMRAVILARKLNRKADELRFLRELVRSGSSDVLPELATALANFGDKESLEESMQLFLDLSSRFPNEPIYRFNLACAYRDLGKTENAIVEFEKVTYTNPEFVYGWEGRVQLLIHSDDRPRALQILDTAELRTRFQGDVRYWRTLHTVAHANGALHLIHECLSRIHALESQSSDSRRTIRVLSTDQLQAFIKQGQSNQLEKEERYDSGFFPSHVLSVGSYHQSWRTRTAPTSFASRGLPAARTQSYVTHPDREFFSSITPQGELGKLPRASGKGSIVVADITGLITLHELGILPQASKYFSKILLPFEYRQLANHEQAYPDPTLGALLVAVQQVLSMIASQQILPLGDAEFPFVPMEELCNWLKKQESLDDSTRTVLDQLSFGSTHQDWNSSSGDLIVDASTLFLLASAGVLELASQAARLRVSDTTRDELERERTRLNWITGSNASAKAMWKFIHSCDSFDFAPAQPKSSESTEDSVDWHASWQCSLFLATKEKLDLLVDDRVIQTVYLNETRDDPNTVFGTELILRDLVANDLLSTEQFSNAYRDLMNWRYRFLEIPLEKLVSGFGNESKAIPEVLLSVRDYLSESMNSTGLMQSPIGKSNPFSFAIVFAVNWARSIIDFVIASWDNESIAIAIRSDRAKWAIENLSPLIPSRISVDAEYYLADILPRLWICKVLLERIGSDDHQRTSELLQLIRKHFKVDESQYCRIVADTIERASKTSLDINLLEQDSEQLRIRIKRSILLHAFEHLHSANVYNLSVQSNAVFLVSGTLRENLDSSVPEDILKQIAFVDRTRDSLPFGPLVFFQSGGKPAGCIAIRDMMYRSDFRARSAAAKYLEKLVIVHPDTMGHHVRELIKQNLSLCNSNEMQTWYPACDLIWSFLDQDWLFNLAGVRQFQFGASWKGSKEYWREVFQPTIHPTCSAPPVAVAGATEAEVIRKALGLLLDSMGLDGVVRRYVAMFQHLPLECPFSLGSFLRGKQKFFGMRKILKSVIGLANSNQILEAYQGTCACIEFWREATTDEKQQIARCVSRLSVACFDQKGETPISRSHILQNKLTQYYATWIRLFGPELNANDTLCLASWMASRFAPVLLHSVELAESPKVAFRKLLKEQIDWRLDLAGFARSYANPTPLTNVWDVQNRVFQMGGPFLFSLLCSVYPNQFHSLYGRLDKLGRKAIDQFFARHTIYQVVGSSRVTSTVFTSKSIEHMYLNHEAWMDLQLESGETPDNQQTESEENQDDGATVVRRFFQTAFQLPLAQRINMWEQLLTIAFNGAEDIAIIESELCSGEFLAELLRKGEDKDLELFPQFVLQVFSKWSMESQRKFLRGLLQILSERQVQNTKRPIVINILLFVASIIDDQESVNQLRLVHLTVNDQQHIKNRIRKLQHSIEVVPAWTRAKLRNLAARLNSIVE